MPAELTSTSHGQTMVLTLRNLHDRCTLGPEIYAAGVEALDVAADNPDIRTVVIAGEGAFFSPGDGPNSLPAHRGQAVGAQPQSMENLHNWIESIRSFPKPVIAAVDGHVVDTGFSLALVCDFIVAAHNAVFTMAYSAMALSPDSGGSWTLARAVPRQLANELLLCGEAIGAERLHMLGVVNRLAVPGNTLREALALADTLNTRAPQALASIKELLNEAPAHALHQQLALERQHFARNLHHAPAGAGITAPLGPHTPT